MFAYTVNPLDTFYRNRDMSKQLYPYWWNHEKYTSPSFKINVQNKLHEKIINTMWINVNRLAIKNHENTINRCNIL